jgi:hypothetical protein
MEGMSHSRRGQSMRRCEAIVGIGTGIAMGWIARERIETISTDIIDRVAITTRRSPAALPLPLPLRLRRLARDRRRHPDRDKMEAEENV